jgi:hypothetical protein
VREECTRHSFVGLHELLTQFYRQRSTDIGPPFLTSAADGGEWSALPTELQDFDSRQRKEIDDHSCPPTAAIKNGNGAGPTPTFHVVVFTPLSTVATLPSFTAND